MSTMFSSSSGLNKSEITVTSTNQILSGYKDYDSNGNLLTGTNAGYDAGVTQGENNMKDGVTLDYDGNHLIQGYKARTSAGVLITGTNKGYDAGVTQGHADRDSGVTVTAASQVLSGYKARTSNGALVTGTNGGWDAGYSAGRSQGQADRDSGVTVTAANQIVSGYKARNSSGSLLTGTATTGRPVSAEYVTEKAYRTGPGSITFSATPGYTYAVVYGGHNGDKCTDASVSGGTKLAFRACYTNTGSEGAAIVILSATSTSVTVTNNTGYPYQGASIVMRVTK